MAAKCKHCPDGAPWFATVEKRDEHIESTHPEVGEDAALAAALGRREITTSVMIEGDEIDLLEAVMFLYEIDDEATVVAEALMLYFTTLREIPRIVAATQLRQEQRDAIAEPELSLVENKPDVDAEVE